MRLTGLRGGPFDLILDVGGSIGEVAEEMHELWPQARLVSFEPIPGAAEANRKRADGRWQVVTTAISDHHSEDELFWFCTNQHTTSSLQAPGTARKRHFGIDDVHELGHVQAKTLDAYLSLVETEARVLVKIDVEGHEGQVLQGGRLLLERATTVVCEVQQDPAIFLGSPSPHLVDAWLRSVGLEFFGVADAFLSPAGEVLQWDGVWTRDLRPWARSREQDIASCENRNSLSRL